MTSTNNEKTESLPIEITLIVRLNGELTRLAGRSRLTVRLPEGSTVEDVLTKLGDENPPMISSLQRAVPVISGRHANRELPLTDGQELALLMPVAGGAHLYS